MAYVVRRPPGTVNLSSRFQPSGTPSSVVGGKVYVTDRGSQARTTEVCPGGSCWAPSLSPNGELLAFYSDKDGPPQLWMFDVASGRSRKLSPIRIRPSSGPATKRNGLRIASQLAPRTVPA